MITEAGAALVLKLMTISYTRLWKLNVDKVSLSEMAVYTGGPPDAGRNVKSFLCSPAACLKRNPRQEKSLRWLRIQIIKSLACDTPAIFASRGGVGGCRLMMRTNPIYIVATS